MTEIFNISNDCDASSETSCRVAATRVYAELKKSGVGERSAFNAAVHLFRHRHPEAPASDAPYIVADWLEPQATH
jgi:hypothetical protein